MDPRVTIAALVGALAMQEGIHKAAANRCAAHRETCQQQSGPGTNVSCGNVNAIQTRPVVMCGLSRMTLVAPLIELKFRVSAGACMTPMATPRWATRPSVSTANAQRSRLSPVPTCNPSS